MCSWPSRCLPSPGQLIEKDYSPVLPQIRATQQADRCGGALPRAAVPATPVLPRVPQCEEALSYDDEWDGCFQRQDRALCQISATSSLNFGNRPLKKGAHVSGKSWARLQDAEELYTGYCDLVEEASGSRLQANAWRQTTSGIGAQWRKNPFAGKTLRPGQLPLKLTGGSAPSRIAPGAALDEDMFAKTCKRAEVISNSLEALSLAPERGALPDVHRVIWRGSELADVVEGKSAEDLELARHRREKLRQAGEKQRHQAHKRYCHQQEKERLLARLRRQKRLEAGLELPQTRQPNKAETNMFRKEAETSDGPLKDQFGNLLVDTLPAHHEAPALGEGGEHEDITSKATERCSSILRKISFKHDKQARVDHLKQVGRSRRRQDRLQRLQESHRREFSSMPEEERDLLTQTWELCDTNGADVLDVRDLSVVVEEFGLVPRTDAEKKEIKAIFDEVGVLGDVDFFAFGLEAVPRIRAKLKELRRIPFLQHFHAYDKSNSGYVSVRNCEQILDRGYTWNIDAKGLCMMRAAFSSIVKKFSLQDDSMVDFDEFQVLAAKVQEQYERILRGREKTIMKEEGVSEADFFAHSEELVSLYDSFTRGNLNDDEGLDKEELRILLIEYGLYPRSVCGQARVTELFYEGDSNDDGILDFSEFLRLIRQTRELCKVSNQMDHRRMFEQYDRDGSGRLAMNEVSALLAELGLTPRTREDQQDMKRILDAIDTDGSNQVEFSEFQALVQRISERVNAAQRRRERHTAKELKYSDAQVAEMRESFYALDVQGKGVLSIDQLRKALDLLRIRMRPENLQESIRRLDVDAEGGLNFEKFLQFMNEVSS